MAFDDDENPNAVGAYPATNAQDVQATEDADEDSPDYKLFLSMFDKAGVSSKAIRKGEKDFESHGTRAQDNLLEASRTVMDNVLSYTRIHREEVWTRGWCFPDWWEDLEWAGEYKELFLRDRVVVMEHERGNWQKDIGRALPAKLDRAAAGRLWLLPEEAVYLVERGTVDLWWPNRQLEELFPKADASSEAKLDLGPDDYDAGLPLSLEAAYSLFIGYDGERGKISLPKYHVFANLKRAGFHVLRAPPDSQSTPATPATPPTKTVWQWLFSFLGQDARSRQQPFGPLVQPGLYRAYRPIYQQLAILPRHKPLPTPTEVHPPEEPFQIFYHVWKTGGVPFSKKSPPPPDFRVAVVDAGDSCLPSLQQIEALLESTPHDPPNEAWKGPGRMYHRLKHGHRNVLVAIVDRGLVNFMRFGEGAFGEERIFERFDNKGGPRGGKKGGRGGGRGRGRGRGRGGRGGRGRGG
ncbi:tRNA-splicing endonuclease subunit sen54 [Neonectria punicea]|uniref:tRNA-splicing endonuclease subunit sen54 n=1 Tax=Neonectria punicea TaxID=979145 RepID=A0ABR1HDC8_9HYPO